jgi:hypothetical protein
MAAAVLWFSIGHHKNRNAFHRPSSVLTARRSAVVSLPSVAAAIPPPIQSGPLLGETILRDYADPEKTPENDLFLMAQLMDSFTLLVKGAADRPLSANEDWARALQGRNPGRERFLPNQHVALNASGQLIDRWGTPLFFHAVGRGEFQIRSAGPDRVLWTADDLQRNADGSFQSGAALTSPNPNPAELTGAL